MTKIQVAGWATVLFFILFGSGFIPGHITLVLLTASALAWGLFFTQEPHPND